MRNVCLIPARSGSKGLKNKNMAFLDNKPVLQYTMDAALESGLFDPQDICVSTDSKKYIEHLRDQGITMLYRNPNLASDTATTADVVLDFLNQYQEDVNIVLLQPTSPMRNGNHLQEAFELYEENSFQSIVVSISEVDKSPNLFTQLGPNNQLSDIIGVDKGYRRQNHSKLYAPNGAIFITNSKQYINQVSFFTDKTIGYLMDKKSSIDIDDIDDFFKAKGALMSEGIKREEKIKTSLEKQLIDNVDNATKIILGDSKAKQLVIEGYKNYSIGDITVKTMLENCKNYLDCEQITKVIINLGINDLIVGYSVSEITSNLQTLVNLFSKAEVTLCTIIPTIYFPQVNNDDIVELNLNIKKMSGINIIDTYSSLVEDENLRFDLTTDGMHLTEKGIEKWCNTVLQGLN